MGREAWGSGGLVGVGGEGREAQATQAENARTTAGFFDESIALLPGGDAQGRSQVARLFHVKHLEVGEFVGRMRAGKPYTVPVS